MAAEAGASSGSGWEGICLDGGQSGRGEDAYISKQVDGNTCIWDYDRVPRKEILRFGGLDKLVFYGSA
jgi:hypothetical protein